MRDQKTKGQQTKNKEKKENTHPLSPHLHPDMNQPPPTLQLKNF